RTGKERAEANDRDSIIAFRRTAGVTWLGRSGSALPRGAHQPSFAKMYWHAGWKIFEDYVDVETTDAKRIHSGTTRLTIGQRRPGDFLARHEDRDVIPGDVWIRGLEIRSGRDHAVLHGQERFDQPRYPGGFARVTNVGLHARHRYPSAGSQRWAEGLGQCFHFGGVAQLRRRAMGFDVLQTRGI